MNENFEAFILLKDADGRFYDELSERFTQTVHLDEGSLLRCLSEVSGRKLSKQLERCYEDMKSVQDPAYLQSLEVANVGIIVSASLIRELSVYQLNILRAITDPVARLAFFNNSIGFRYVESLKIGDEVLVQLSSGPQPQYYRNGTINWIRELPGSKGLYFGILVKNFSQKDGTETSEAYYITGDQIRRPSPNDIQVTSFFGPYPVTVIKVEGEPYVPNFVEKLKQESLAAGVTGQRKSRSEKTGTYRSVRRRAASHPSRSKLERYISYNF
ncbi:unnamed protein product [Enterobius vermicularis]|uniref:DUF4384 domain-containing protein n=1 Tax=Enterobius vermicularis TaxID=51028 RepID=A0A0N4V1H4_ENTVE|nr:unnamed protein product [Enterobius vermicularis]